MSKEKLLVQSEDVSNVKDLRQFNITKRVYIAFMSIFNVADKIFGAIFTAFMNLVGLATSQISALFSIQEILLAIFDYPTGTISDRIGRKRITAYGLFVRGIGIIWFAYATSFIMFLPSIVLMALGVALISGAPSSWIIDHMIKDGVYDKREQILPRISGLLQLGSIVASIIAYFLVDKSSKLAIVVAGILHIIAGFVALIFGEDNYGKVKSNHFIKNLGTQFVDFIKEKRLIFLAIRNVVVYIPFAIFVIYWQIYAVDFLKIKAKYLSIYLLVFMVFLMLGNYIVSFLTKKITGFMATMVGLVVTLLGFIILFFSIDLVAFTIGACLIELGFGIEQAATSTWSCDFVKSETRATYSSIFSTIRSVVGAGLVLILGFIADKFSLGILWIIAGVAVIVDMIILRELGKKCGY